jgi:hypothetical protein
MIGLFKNTVSTTEVIQCIRAGKIDMNGKYVKIWKDGVTVYFKE